MTYQFNPPTGFLVERIDVYQATATDDGQGGQSRTYAKTITVPGKIRETHGSAFSETEGRMISWSMAGAWLDMRADPAKTPKSGDRLVAGGATYEVLSQAKLVGLVECQLKRIVV